MLALIKQFGSIRRLADAIDTAPNYLSQIKNDANRHMGDELARQFEEKLGNPLGWMDQPHHLDEAAALYPHGVPVVGTAQLGDDGFWLELEYPAGHGDGFVRYPMKDPNTYALRVKGDSMRPRIKPGEFVVIEPNHPVRLGEEVMVQTKDGRSMVKLLVSRRDGLVELHSVNELHRPMTIDESNIEKMHYVAAILKAPMYYERAEG